jgi:hypothetical protein
MTFNLFILCSFYLERLNSGQILQGVLSKLKPSYVAAHLKPNLPQWRKPYRGGMQQESTFSLPYAWPQDTPSSFCELFSFPSTSYTIEITKGNGENFNELMMDW